MAKVSARAVYEQNTAVMYYEPSESGETPVSTARIVPVGAANAGSANRRGATLQLVGGMIERDERHETPDGRLDPAMERAERPQVVEVEPPSASARSRPDRSGPRA